MKFWAIAYLYQEDVFYDLKEKDTTIDLSSTCFLPTEELAKQYIEDELSTDFVPVKIDLETLQNNGCWSYTRGKVSRWDEIEEII